MSVATTVVASALLAAAFTATVDAADLPAPANLHDGLAVAAPARAGLDVAPLGITEWEWPYSPSNEPMTGGGLRLRSRDLAKISAMLIDGGRWKGKQIAPKSWVDSALSVHRKAYSDSNYGYLFWQRDYVTPCGTKSGWYMAGNGGNAIVMFRDLRTAVVVTRTNYNTRGMHQQTIDLLQRYVLPAVACTAARR